MCEITVTAVITTHNRADLLPKAINSVLNQTFKDFELLVIDDASVDNTEEVVNTFMDSRMRYIKIKPEHSKGGNHARNIGVKESKSDFIAFLDDDDEWMPEKLEKQLEVFKKDNDVGLVYTGVKFIYVDESFVKHQIPVKRGDLSKDILLYNSIGGTSSVMIKKKKIEEAGLFDINLPAAQEYDIFIRLCQICKIDFAKEILVKYYFKFNINRISNNLDKFKKACFLIDEKYNDLILNLNTDLRKKRTASIYSDIGTRAGMIGNFGEVKKYYFKALLIKFSFKTFIKFCLTFIGIYHFPRFIGKVLLILSLLKIDNLLVPYGFIRPINNKKITSF